MYIKHKELFFIVLILSLLSNIKSFSQNPLSGKVIDKQSKQAISYANVTILNKNKHLLTDENGTFSLEFITDTLIISAIGYEQDTIWHFQDSLTALIELVPTIYTLPIIEVNQKNKKIKKVGAIKRSGKTTSSNCLKANIEIGIKVKNPSFNSSQFAKLTEASFYITRKGIPQTPFRVRVYEYDSDMKKPIKNVLSTNVICTPMKGGEWYSVDLSSYFIPISTRECVIVMEWLYYEGIQEYKMYSSKESKNLCFGQTIGLTNSLKENLTWTRINRGRWSNSDRRRDSKSKHLNVAINATFEVY